FWGRPNIYFPNRLADGVLKTSDAEYHWPVNEKNHYNNHIHGFLHKRVHSVEEYSADENSAWVKTKFVFDRNDEFYQYFPVDFTAEYTFTLSADGLKQDIKFTNNSEKVLPISIGSHTAMQAPFVDGAKLADIRLQVPAMMRCELNERCLPTEDLLDLSDWDKEYVDGTKVPVLQNLDNDMYAAGRLELDGKPFSGIIAEDRASGIKICYEVSDEYRFWIIWNDQGFNGYFCPEPMTAMINAPNLSLSPSVSGYREIIKGQTFECSQHFFVAL
ncbi:MAG: aldose 1-epimerase, partial [Oscillospiraceae bacterium]|nr:aldose 1-epimerase [Oscillospiraceae bacterium]